MSEYATTALAPMTPNWLYATFQAFSERHRERIERTEAIDKVLRGDFDMRDPAGNPLDQATPNHILTALEDTADAAAVVPSIRVSPASGTQASRKTAAKMESIGTSYFDHNELELMMPVLIQDWLRTGMAAFTVLPDVESKMPQIMRRDPNCTFPEPTQRPTTHPRRCIFARQIYVTQLPIEYQDMLKDKWVSDPQCRAFQGERERLTLIEYMDAETVCIGGFFMSTAFGPKDNNLPIVFEQFENKLHTCPAIVLTRTTWDGESRGQYDQVISTLLSFARLQAMVLDYADQSVYSDVWVKDLIGEMPWGGGGFIELGPNGAIGRVAPATSSMNVDRDLERLQDELHVHSRWPKSRPGQVDQSIASGKFVEATVGMMNTLIKSIHQSFARGFAHGLQICYATDRAYFPGTKTATGILRNQEYLEEYDARKDIDLNNKVRVEYGLGLGKDPSQSAVLMLQYQDKGLVSTEFVQENIDGVTDVERERRRIDNEDFGKMLKANMLQGLQSGQIDPSKLPDIMDARMKGEALADIYRKYVAPPPPAAPADGSVPPGPAPAGAPPGAEPPSPLGAPGAGPVPPPAPDASGLLTQLSTPAGGKQNYMSSRV